MTCQVSVSHAIEGFLKSAGGLAGEKVGGRSVMADIVPSTCRVAVRLLIRTVHATSRRLRGSQREQRLTDIGVAVDLSWSATADEGMTSSVPESTPLSATLTIAH